MKKEEKAILLLVTSVLFFILARPVQAEEQDSTWITFITMVYSVTPKEDTPEMNFLAYIPIITDDSIPVYLKLSEEAKYNTHVSGFTFKTIKGDGNLVRVTLKDLKKDMKYYLAFETYTLKKVENYEDLPKFVSQSSYSGLSDELKYYTQPSLSVQSSAPAIRTKAYEIFYGTWTGNIREALEKIVEFTAETIEYKALGDQTALATLGRGYGVCTGKANLAVALARALGIPARILSVLASHFVIEFWIPDYGWVRGESTMGLFPDNSYRWTAVWVGDIEDEDFFGSSGGIIAYLGIEGNGNATWYPEYDEIALPEHWIQKYATVDGDSVRNTALFARGSMLWRLYCQIQNLKLEANQGSLFHAYQESFFQSLLKNDIDNALIWADVAIEEGKRLAGIEEYERAAKSLRKKEKIHEKSRLPFGSPRHY